MRRWARQGWQWVVLGLVALVSALALSALGELPAHPRSATPDLRLPAAQVHPLPPTLKEWGSPDPSDDYFDQVQPTRVGYLVWSQFPVRVAVAAATLERETELWQSAVAGAIADWQPYLPITAVPLNEPDESGESDTEIDADIIIEQIRPRLGTGRARSAETRFSLYINPQGHLAHRCTIYIRPSQTEAYTLASVRHELGHALGIWGHSPLQTDALYFAQVRDPAPISVRDINTLKRIYEQPTHLGWSVTVADES
nr:peptidase [Petrachloros mirabilis]